MVELAIAIFVGLVLFAAFGRKATEATIGSGLALGMAWSRPEGTRQTPDHPRAVARHGARELVRSFTGHWRERSDNHRRGRTHRDRHRGHARTHVVRNWQSHTQTCASRCYSGDSSSLAAKARGGGGHRVGQRARHRSASSSPRRVHQVRQDQRHRFRILRPLRDTAATASLQGMRRSEPPRCRLLQKVRRQASADRRAHVLGEFARSSDESAIAGHVDASSCSGLSEYVCAVSSSQ